MVFKSPTQPHCRYCGKAIRKRTDTVLFGMEDNSISDFWIYRQERPLSKAEAQKLVNRDIVSVRWFRSPPGNPDWGRVKSDPGYDFVNQVTVWDGESYEDEFFCNGDHAKAFGYAAARAGYITEEFRKVVGEE